MVIFESLILLIRKCYPMMAKNKIKQIHKHNIFFNFIKVPISDLVKICIIYSILALFTNLIILRIFNDFISITVLFLLFTITSSLMNK